MTEASPSSLMQSLLDREGGAAGSQRNLFSNIERSMVGRLKLERLLEGHHGCVNAVSWNKDGSTLYSGSDDLMINVWNRMGSKIHSFSPGHTSNIFQSKPLEGDDSTILSAAADGHVRVSTLGEGGQVTRRLLARHRGRCHKLSIDPENPQAFVSCGEDGKILFFDLRQPEPVVSSHLVLEEGLNAVAFNPTKPWQLAAAGDDTYCHLFDTRGMPAPDPVTDVVMPTALIAPDEMTDQRSRHITHCCFSSRGQLLLSYHRHDLFLFDPISEHGTASGRWRKRARSEAQEGGEEPETKEEDYIDASASKQDWGEFLPNSTSSGFLHPRSFTGHRNSQTVKSCSFLGGKESQSQYVMSGSDCGRIFIWESLSGRLVQLLQGDRHVVNVLEPHPLEPLTFATCGIEDSIKLWGPRSQEDTSPSEEMIRSVVEGNRRPTRVLSPGTMARMLIHRRNAVQGSDDDDEGGDDGEEESEMPSWAFVEGETSDAYDSEDQDEADEGGGVGDMSG